MQVEKNHDAFKVSQENPGFFYVCKDFFLGAVIYVVHFCIATGKKRECVSNSSRCFAGYRLLDLDSLVFQGESYQV